MKKVSKLLSIALVAILMLFTFAQPVCFADEGGDQGGASSITGQIKPGKTADPAITSVAQKITTWIWGISIVVAVIVIMIIGVKFIIGGTQEKAEYKKSLMPIVVGVILVVFATTLVNFLFSINGGN